MTAVRSRWGVPSVFLVLLVSGCTAPIAPEVDPGAVTTDAALAFDARTCSIEGFVMDDQFRPVEGVQVQVQGTKTVVQAMSTVDGGFTFEFLPPAVYEVAATKAGHGSDAKSVLCQANATAQVQLGLKRLPDAKPGFVTIFALEKGRIGCGVGYYSVSTADLCKATGIDADGRAEFAYKPDLAPITGVVYQLEWTPAGTLGTDVLALDYMGFKTTSSDVELNTSGTTRTGDVVAGRSPMTLRARTLDLTEPLYSFAAPDSRLPVNIRPAGSPDPANVEDSSKVVFGQDFSLYVALFYLGAPIPADFTMLHG